MSGLVMPMPMTKDELTLDWLAHVLRSTHGIEVSDMRISAEIPGAADKVLVDIVVADTGSADDVPASMCVKGGFTEATRRVVASGYISEARFFQAIASTLPASLPRCWYAEADESLPQGIAILDNLIERGATFGDPLTGLSPDQAASALEVQAAWHAATWRGKGLERFTWLKTGSDLVRGFIAVCLTEAVWKQGLEKSSEAIVPSPLRDRTRIAAAQSAVAALNAAGPLCLAHGDAHVGNTYIESDGAIGFLDWQTVSRGSWADDVAYFVVGALECEDRREHEADLLQHYLTKLFEFGVPPESIGDAHSQYHRQHLHGLMWGFMPEGYQTADRCAVMVERYAAAAMEHDTLGLLGV